MKKSRIIIVVLGLAVIAIAAGIGWRLYASGRFTENETEEKKAEEGIVASPTRVAIKNGEVVVTLDEEARAKGGIAAAAPGAIFHQETITGYGTILSTRELVDLNDRYAGLRASAEKARAALEAAKNERDRAAALNADEKNVSDKAAQAAEAEWRSAEAEARAALQALASAENLLRERWGDTIARWTIESDPELNGIVAQKELLVQITLPPGAASGMKPETAYVESAEDTRRLIEARFIAPARRTDPRIQGRSFFYRVAAGAGGLLPEMNVSAHLPTGATAAGFLIPDSAIVWWQGSRWIYVQSGADQFTRREIRPEASFDGGWFVREGVTAADRIVVAGAPLLFSEELRSQIQVGEE